MINQTIMSQNMAYISIAPMFRS
jgi:hypothetical protein